MHYDAWHLNCSAHDLEHARRSVDSFERPLHKFRGLVAEIQLVHNDMMLVRENMGAHDGYDQCRFAAEFLQKEFKSQEKAEVIKVLKPSICAECGLMCANCQ